MAARKKKVAAQTKKFLALVSECGGDEQLKPVNDYDTTLHTTAALAQKEAEKDAESRSNDGDGAASYVIAEIVQRGSSAGLVWK